MTKSLPLLLLTTLLTTTTTSQTTFPGPIHGCEWVQGTTPITNFTYFDASNSNSSTSSYVTWQAPMFGVTCFASDPSSAKYIGCGQRPDEPNTIFRISPKEGLNRTAEMRFYTALQCLGSRWAFYYEAKFEVGCVLSGEGVTCKSVAGNVTATYWRIQYLSPSYPGPYPPEWLN